MEDTTSTTSCCCSVMGFGDNNNISAPNPMMFMMMPTSTCPHPYPINPIPILNHNHNPPPPTININNNNINNNNLSLPSYYNHLPLPNPISSSTINTFSDLGPLFMDKINPNEEHGEASSSSVKAKIMAHPHYHRLLAAYVNCQKVGAPAEAVARLEEACAAAAGGGGGGGGGVGEDPALDQFMEAYCEMLTKYEEELSKPFKEAMHFLHSIESQFKALTLSSSSSHFACGEATEVDRNVSSDEDADVANDDVIDPLAEDRELKGQLLRKYSGYLGSLKQEFMKKRKKGKLPKEARQQLLDWWSKHCKWPYPSESQKVALAESTGLDQKQINNWFINQRKRHWKPSEDMQFMVMDPSHPHHHYYIDAVLANPYPMNI